MDGLPCAPRTSNVYTHVYVTDQSHLVGWKEQVQNMDWISRVPHKSLLAFAILTSVFVAPGAAVAQQAIGTAGAWRVEPTVGVWRQPHRGPATDHRIGQFVGLGFSRQTNSRLHPTVSLGYYRLGEALEVLTTAQGQPRTEVYDSELLPVSAGATVDLWKGSDAALGVGLELGAVWARDRLTSSIGPEPLAGVPKDDWTPSFLAAPSLGVRRALAPQLDLNATGRLLLGFGDFSPTTIPTLALGLGYQF